MTPICDFHMHTPLCGHAQGQPEEYAAEALKKNLKIIGFSDHAPMVHYRDPSVTMDISQLPDYHKMIEDVRSQFADKLDIRIGIEADFVPGFEDKTKAILDGYPYDYVIGSVHFINQWGFDNPDDQDRWKQENVNDIYRQYYAHLRGSAESGMFDIIAHSDLVKKYGQRPTDDLNDEVHRTAEVFKENNMVIEINTSGRRKPVGEMYPAPDVLKIYSEHGVLLTFGSDAHLPGDVGCDFDLAVELALSAGYKEYVTFKNRCIENQISLS